MSKKFFGFSKRIINSRFYLSIRNRLFHYKGSKPLKVIIVGFPRSGTSFLAGLIVRMGFDPGPVNYLRSADDLNPYGYYENTELMKIDHELLKKFDGNAMEVPSLPVNWLSQCEYESKTIQKIVQSQGIQLYKGNMLIVLADLYDRLFPNVKWIFISRSHEDIVKSLLNADKLNLRDQAYYTKTVQSWAHAWDSTDVSSKAFHIKYEDFSDTPDELIRNIASFLNVSLSSERLNECIAFFKPNKK